ncbi:MAG: M14 family metallopeptidase [Candidatus Aminicenantes bacterium]|jgi:murein tripeptide amidase MpaA
MVKLRQTLIIILIFLLVFVMAIDLVPREKASANTRNSQYRETIISMTIDDYRAFLKTHPPLDRLYRQGDTGFFLVNSRELSEIKASGAEVQSQEPVPGDFPGTPPADRTQGDINGAYHNYNETNTLLREWESNYPGMAQVTTIGYSIEGRELNVIKISDNVSIDEAEPNIFIVGCHHAREWISVEVPLLFAQYLLEHYPDNPEVRRAVNGVQVYIMPIQNPDGLEFSIHTYRMWRKNRRYNGNLSWGVDPNRNYGYMWGYDDEGSSPDPNSGVYRGPAPFSEPETEAVRQFLLAHPPAGTLSYHNYSQLIIYPWGYTHEPAPDAEEMDQIAAAMSNLIYQVNGRFYTYGAADILYITNGDTTDWVYGTFGTPAFTIELPPDNALLGGFFTSLELIDSAFRENLPALLYFVNYFVTDENQVGNPSTVRTPGDLFPKQFN